MDSNEIISTPPSQSNKEAVEESIFRSIHKFTAKNSTSPKAPTIKDFTILKPISRGAFGKVFLGHKNTTPNQLLAIKVMRKLEMINKNMVSQVITERNALALSRSPFCVNLLYSLQTPMFVYLVMEFMPGGDLKSLLAMYGYFEESAAKFYAAEVSLALQYLHSHGIVHRDIKPDNLLISTSGHIKLTDFGLSKIELSRELEISDLINCSPNLNARTPGQLLSLTSHLSFGSAERRSFREMQAAIREQEEHNESKMSGISPFQSAEDINVSLNTSQNKLEVVETSSSYFTCNSSVGSRRASRGNSTGRRSLDLVRSSICNRINSNLMSNNLSRIETGKENQDSANFSKPLDCSAEFEAEAKQLHCIREDSGVSSRESDDASEKTHSKEEASSCSEYSCENSRAECLVDSPRRSFKRPAFFRGVKRKRSLLHRTECYEAAEASGGSTGLTQEIDIMDIGSSTPKKKQRTSPTSPVVKPRSLSDDELPPKDHLANVLFSTPVSSQKKRDGPLAKLKATRFALPSSVENARKISSLALRCKMAEEPAVSPIVRSATTTANRQNSDERTPKTQKTPYRTPKSVRRCTDRSSEERILGTPDYLAPELLLMQGHGPAVDWWALGVCLYEFVTGVPPFNDETPQKVFENILNREIEWPAEDEALSESAVEAIEALLTMEPEKRPSFDGVKAMRFFAGIDWNNHEALEPPFVPNPDSPHDTCYFEARNTLQHLKLSNFEADV